MAAAHVREVTLLCITQHVLKHKWAQPFLTGTFFAVVASLPEVGWLVGRPSCHSFVAREKTPRKPILCKILHVRREADLCAVLLLLLLSRPTQREEVTMVIGPVRNGRTTWLSTGLELLFL